MPALHAWGARLLYAFLIGRTDSDERIVPRESFDGALTDLFERLKAALGGITKIKPFEAVGDTIGWGTEPATVVLVLAEQAQERAADSIIAEEARRLSFDLRQDEVWVTKQILQLYIGRNERD